MPWTTRPVMPSRARTDLPDTVAEGTHSAGGTGEAARGEHRRSSHPLSAFLRPLSSASRRPEPSLTANDRAVRRTGQPKSLTQLPADVLRKIGTDLRATRDVAHLALATSSLQSVLAPENAADKISFLKEAAASAQDLESYRLVLRTARTLPPELHTGLLTVLASRLSDLATGNGSFLQMQAAAKDSAERFRLLSTQVADLPAELRTGPSAALAPNLAHLPLHERFSAMETLLAGTREQASHPDRLQMMRRLALAMHQFDRSDVPRAALHLLDEAATWSREERRSLAADLRMGLDCKILLTDKATVEAALKRFEAGH